MLQLVYALTGDDAAPPILDGLVDQFVTKLRLSLEDILWEGSLRKYKSAHEFLDVYDALSEEKRAAFLLCPETYRFFSACRFRRDPDHLERLLRHCRKYLELDPRELLYSSATTDSPATGNSPVFLSLLDETTVIDGGSDACRRRDPTSPVFFRDYDPFPARDWATTVRKIEAAFREISEISPTFARLIKNYTRRIYVRKVGKLPPASEQVDTEIGAIRLRNVHLSSYDHDQLVDDLIHESVHNFLSSYEFVNFPFVKFGSQIDPNMRPVSPWSMRPIRILPFLHACFVYFTLFHYATRSLLLRKPGKRQKQALQRRRNRYVSGFLMPGRLRDHLGLSQEIDPRVLQCLDWLQEIVTARTSDIMFGTERRHEQKSKTMEVP